MIDIAHCAKKIHFEGDVQKNLSTQLPRCKSSIKRGRKPTKT